MQNSLVFVIFFLGRFIFFKPNNIQDGFNARVYFILVYYDMMVNESLYLHKYTNHFTSWNHNLFQNSRNFYFIYLNLILY